MHYTYLLISNLFDFYLSIVISIIDYMAYVLINKLHFEFFGYRTVACFLPIPVYNIFK